MDLHMPSFPNIEKPYIPMTASGFDDDTWKAIEEMNELRRESQIAAIETSKNVSHIKDEVETVRSSIEDERNERITQDKKNFSLAVLGAVCGVLGTVSSLAALIVSIVK